MIIDSTGVGIGTSSPSNLFHISSATGDSVEMKITNTNADAIGANIHLEKDSASPADNDFCGEITWVGSNDNNQQPSFGSVSVQMTDVSDGTEDGDMIFKTSSAGTFAERARISGNNLHLNGGTDARIQLGSGGAGANSTSNDTVHIRGDGDDMKLMTAADGNYIFENNGTERARIVSDGTLLVGATSTGRTTAGHEQHASGFARHTRSGDKALELVRTSSDGEVFEIFKDGTLKQTMGTASNSIFSDKKVKKDIKSLDLGLNLIEKLNPTEYRHIIDDEGSPKSFGLIAQEFEKSLEEVGVEKNSTYLLQHKPSDGDTNSDYWLDYSKLTPVLIKAIQEQQTIIDDLKSRIQTLEDA
jgi:hypothetical protein